MNELLKHQGEEISICLSVCFFPYGISGCISLPKPSRGQKEHFSIHLIWVLEGWEAVLNSNMKTSPLCLSICAQRMLCAGFNCRVYQGNILITGEITEIFKPHVNSKFQASDKPNLHYGEVADMHLCFPNLWGS